MTKMFNGIGDGVSAPIEGRASILEGWNPGDILVTTETSPAHLYKMMQAPAVVTMVGGRMSHAAVVCTEMNKPFVVGLGTTALNFHNKFIRVDGKAGTVEILE